MPTRIVKPFGKHKPVEISNTPVDQPQMATYRQAFDAHLKVQIPNPLDYVFFSAIPILEEFNNQDFHHQADPLCIEALSRAPTLFYGCDTTPAVHLLTRANTFIKVQLKVICDLNYGWDAGIIVVEDEDRWVPLKQWLKTLPKSIMKNIDGAALELQRQWWLRDQGHFRLLDLPTELQKRIFLFAIGPYVFLERSLRCRNLGTRVDDAVEHAEHVCCLHLTGGFPPQSSFDADLKYHGYTAPSTIRPVSMALLHLSKRLHHLAVEVLWADTTKVCHSACDLSWLLRDVPERYLGFVRRIQLRFSNYEYLCAFNVELWPPLEENMSRDFDGELYTTALTKLPNLQYLELYFHSTISNHNSPWACYSRRNEIALWGVAPPDFDHHRPPCQRVLIDMMMCFIYEHVRHIPTVTLSGWVKSATKEKWERMLNDKSRTDHLPLVEGMKRKVMGMHYTELPPLCLCRHPCGYSAVDSLRGYGERVSEFKEAERGYVFDVDDTMAWESRWVKGQTACLTGAEIEMQSQARAGFPWE